MIDEPGPLVASGRAADVYDLGDGTVLRRYRTDHDNEPEARAMAWLADQGYPVPRVVTVDGRDLVMERIDGPTMLDDLAPRPWMVASHGRTLARLQRQLAALAAPGWLAPVEGPTGGGVLHLDLHPMNVILSPRGPVVIDWTNCGRGDPSFDAAYSYLLMRTFEATSPLDRFGRRLITGAFRRARGRTAVDHHLVAACDRRLADPNTTPGEAELVRRLQARHRPTG